MTDFSTAYVELSGDTDVIVKRAFNAPPELVWAAHTRPDLLRRWLGGYPGWTMPVCEVDLRVGGSYRYRWRNDEDGSEFGFVGTYREVEEYARIVNSERYDADDAWGEAINTTTFEGDGARTIVTTKMSFPTAEARKAATETGMTDGMEVSYKQLDGLILEEQAA